MANPYKNPFYHWLSKSDTNEATWLMCPWWVKMPTENLTDLAIDDTYGNDLRCGGMEFDKVADIVLKILNEDFTDVTLATDDT